MLAFYFCSCQKGHEVSFSALNREGFRAPNGLTHVCLCQLSGLLTYQQVIVNIEVRYIMKGLMVSPDTHQVLAGK